jgi:beta-lactam-binding protein with PASTA domain
MSLWTADNAVMTADGFQLTWTADGFYPGVVPGTVPNVVNFQQDYAKFLINQAQLTLYRRDYYVFSNSVPLSYVVSQSPIAGTVLPLSGQVTLTISAGPAPVIATATVPNVVGLYVWDALRVINAAQLIANPFFEYAESVSIPAEYVISQSLAAGSIVVLWSSVTLVVSSGVP